ncbi:MAG: helix-turn-helix domain-containing protein [Spirochaetota bacterium]|mgnify:CR=1 FL=1
MGNSPKDIVTSHLRALSSITGVGILYKDASGATGIDGLPSELHIHENSFCMAVKSDDRRWDACKAFYTEANILNALNGACAGVIPCHAGVHQLVIPLTDDGRYYGALIAGPLRGSTRCPYADCRRASMKVPARERYRIDDIKSILAVLSAYLIENRGRILLERMKNRDKRIDLAIDYIADHEGRDVSAADAALRSGLSVSRFLHIFRNVAGMPFSEHLIRTRIEAAKRLLSAGDMTVGDIAARTGYVQQSHFGAVFKRITGLTPKAYREKTRSVAP